MSISKGNWFFVIWTCAIVLLTLKPLGGQDLISRVRAAEKAGRLDETRYWLTQLAQQETVLNPNGPLLAMALGRLASVVQDQAHFDAAEQFYLRSIQLWEDQPDSPSLGLADTLNGLASLYNATGRLEKSEAMCRKAVAIRLKLLGSKNEQVAIAYSNLGVVLRREKKYREAGAVAQQALDLWTAFHSHRYRSAVRSLKDSSPLDRLSLIEYLHTLAVIQWKAGRRSESLAAFEKAFTELASISFPNSLETKNLLNDYAGVLHMAGDKKKARAVEKAAKIASAAILKINPGQQYTVDVSSLLAQRP